MHRTVHAARGFAGSVQARNQMTLNMVDLRLFVGVETAHAVVNLGRHACNILGTVFELLCFSVYGTPDRILLGINRLVRFSNGLLERLNRNIELLGQIFERLEFEHHAAFKLTLDHARTNFLEGCSGTSVTDSQAVVSLVEALENGKRTHLAVGQFVYKALAGRHIAPDTKHRNMTQPGKTDAETVRSFARTFWPKAVG